jgi:hypothetical protein
MFGRPDTYGIRPDGHCSWCGGLREHQSYNAWGVFCLACCNWLAYWGPAQAWGDGMGGHNAGVRIPELGRLLAAPPARVDGKDAR